MLVLDIIKVSVLKGGDFRVGAHEPCFWMQGISRGALAVSGLGFMLPVAQFQV